MRGAFFWLFLSLSALVFASQERGYIMRYHNFYFSVQFGLDEEKDDSLVRSDKVFWDLLSWFYCNRTALSENNGYASIYLYGEALGQQALLQYHDKDENIPPVLYKFIYDPGSGGKMLVRILSSVFNTGSSLVKEEDAAIGFYRMAVYYKNYDQMDWRGDYGRSAVFFGSIPSYMYDDCRKEYFILFWTQEEADSFIAKHQLRNYSLRHVVITKSNVYEIFGTMK